MKSCRNATLRHIWATRLPSSRFVPEQRRQSHEGTKGRRKHEDGSLARRSGRRPRRRPAMAPKSRRGRRPLQKRDFAPWPSPQPSRWVQGEGVGARALLEPRGGSAFCMDRRAFVRRWQRTSRLRAFFSGDMVCAWANMGTHRRTAALPSESLNTSLH
jgi:hypothetical protein